MSLFCFNFVYLFLFFRFYILVKSHGIYISTSDLFHLAEYLHSPSMLLQMTGFHSFFFWWLSNTPVCVSLCMRVCVCVHKMSLFIHSSIDEQLGCFHILATVKTSAMNRGACIFWNYVFFCVF